MALIAHEKFTETQSSPGVHQPGEVVKDLTSKGLKKYKYVKYDNGSGGLSLSAGDVLYYLEGSDYDGYTVTKDVSDTDINNVAGVAVSSMSDGGYGFMQVYGYYGTVATPGGTDNFGQNDALIGGGDGTLGRTAADTAPTNKVLGWALADDSDTDDTVAAHITISA